MSNRVVQAGALLCLFLAGCTVTPRGLPAPTSVDLTEETSTPVTPPVPEAPPAALPRPVEIASIPTVPMPTVVPAPPAAEVETNDTWISLERWCEVNGFGAPKRSSSETPPTFLFSSAAGVMSIKIGSELARWNGLEYRLGFAPELFGGHPYVHALDVRKNFQPLMASFSPPGTGQVIVIDPGHGGSDAGASNVYNGHFEKEYALDEARRLQAVLVSRGWTVFLTRSNDVFVPLADRVAFAEQHHAGLFISLHFNSAFPDRQQSGLETYCLTPSGMASTLTRGYADNPALIYPNNRFDDLNMELAVQVHRALLEANGHQDRGVRRARFLTVLQGQNRPAILVEGGYLSNPQEARQIADAAYRQKLAEALAQALTGNEWDRRTSLASQSLVAPPATNSDGKIN